MRRITLVIFILMFSLLNIFCSPVYMVDTDRGKKAVTIPEDMSEREVLLELAKEYYNLSYKLEDYVEANEELLAEIDKYKEQVDSYIDKNNELIDKYADVVEDYKKLNSSNYIKGLLGISAGLGDITAQSSNIFTLNRLSISGGILLNTRVGILGSLDYYTTQSFGFSLGMLLAI